MAGTNSKQGGARKKPTRSLAFWAGRTFLVVVILVVSIGVLWSVWRWYRPEHHLNPINRFGLLQLYEARESCQGSCIPQWNASMIPEVFRIDDHRAEVLERLADAGYILWFDEGHVEHYQKRGAGTGALFVCGTNFVVAVSFSQVDNLLSAESYGTGLCV